METELQVRIPGELKKKLVDSGIDVESVVKNALERALADEADRRAYIEVKMPEGKQVDDMSASDIPQGSFLRVPNLSSEQFERIVGEDCWEYIDGKLIHHSPESLVHNTVLNHVIHVLKGVLPEDRYLLFSSRVALSVGGDKPEPDLMIFKRKGFRRLTRKDGTPSDIIESVPLLVMELVSSSSMESDERKKHTYYTKGVTEYWLVHVHGDPMKVIVCELRDNNYDCKEYVEGEVRSRIIPEFALEMKELEKIARVDDQ